MNEYDDIIKYSKKLRILYVEDNAEVRDATMQIFNEYFKEVIVAIDGQDGYEKFSSDTFDLVITDINMPKLNGLEMIEKIRKIDREISIIILSAYNESNFLMDSITLGVDGYLLKPINMTQLTELFYKVIQKFKMAQEAQRNLDFLNAYEEITNASAIVSKTDPDGIITYVNDNFCNISGYTREELIGKNHNFFKHPETPKEIYKELWDTIKNKKSIWKGIIHNLSKNGSIFYLEHTIKPILDSDGKIIEYIALRNNITDIMNPKKQLDNAIRNIKEPLVLYLRLEDFQTMEELYDNEKLEMIQNKITLHLEQYFLKTFKFDKIYQLGNGEYAIAKQKSLCKNNKDEFIVQLKLIQNNIKNNTLAINGINYDISIIISLAYDGTRVLESAKLGIKELLHTKEDFIISNNFAQMKQEKTKTNLKTISMIKNAIDDSKIISYFQPIINNKTKKIEKYESLVRLIDEETKVLSPYFFLDIAKKSKHYHTISHIVLDNSFHALQNTDMEISMNLSALDIESEATREKFINLLEENKQHASRVVIELLEDENISDIKTIKTFIASVKAYGVKIAIDDFGAGYSNFERLLDYQPDILKIDGSLVSNVETNNYSVSIIKTIVTFAKEQNLKTVAEYIENEEIFKIIKILGVDYSQGYFFGKPEPLKSIL